MYEQCEVGDKLRCIRSTTNVNWLIEGNIYTIARIYHDRDYKNTTVHLVEAPYSKCGIFTLSMWFEPDYRLKKINKIKKRIFDKSK